MRVAGHEPRPRRMTVRVSIVLLATILLAGTLMAAGSDSISPGALQQIQALIQEKETRTPVQRKLDSNLLYALKMSRGQEIAAGVASIQTGLPTDPGAIVEVDITAVVTDRLLDTLERLRGSILSSYPAYRTLRAVVPLAEVEAIAASPDVLFVQPRRQAMTHGTPAPRRTVLAAVSPGLLPRLAPGFAERAARVRAAIRAALRAVDGKRPAATLVTNTSEGDVTHRANTARSTYGVSGKGVKVGVLSDGVNSLSMLQASGDLPAGVTVLPGQAGSGDEGSAMMEIVHDLAPNAQLFFATAFNGLASFAQNIRDLRAAGCDVIADDVFYFNETPFQKGQAPSVSSNTNGGIITQAINDVVASGALYFTSAGNEGNLNSGTSGTWEGDFADAGAVGTPISGTGNLLDFDPGAGVSAFDTITASGFAVTLHWSDPLGASGNDYDLFVLNSTGTTVLSSSTNVQSGTQDPYEQCGSDTNGNRVVVVKRTGAANRFLHVSTIRGKLAFNTDGEVHGHSATAVPNAFSVAATPAAAGIGPPPNPTGPYPGAFNSSNKIELFSSDGPRRFFFNADSSAITPGNFSSTGGELLNKPDVTAADGVSVAAPGFNPFFGTSAAAPHAAAIAALVKSTAPNLTATQISNFLTSTAIDIHAAGVDRDSGAGIVDAFAAVQAAGGNVGAFFFVSSTTATEVSGNGDGFVEPGETGSLAVQLGNVNSTTGATGISATLTASTPGVTITAGSSAYPDIPGGGTGTNSVLFQFSLSPAAPCPLTIQFTLTITYSGGPSPQSLTFGVRVGRPPLAVTSTLDATPPELPPGAIAATTGTQNLRLFRDGTGSVCAGGKPFPGTFGSGTRQYDAYTFVNCSSATACIHAALLQNSGATNALFFAAYTGSFVPTNIATNWAADPGTSGTSTGFSFNVAAGATFVIVVNEVNQGGGIGASYTLTLDGICLPCATGAGFNFHTLTPCRVVDTRDPAGAYGGPSLIAGADRAFVFTNRCGIPATAKAIALNITATQPTAGPGFLTAFSGGTALPFVSTVTYDVGMTRANNAVVPLGTLGDLIVHCGQGGGTVDVVIDVNGYFQ